ncbi:tetratricopeptide repeat protein [uncultured Pseudoteredinibacter sp.]|uniref:tetratricopeptide repeat protein n=1 Tax=uncultured Pseudoteredinibacter sp. TaxID=1641701 RepID=UPI002619B06F|nr:tetratricopeptide repeat protein [uncultured Pseudoteredinibacter sp.]
MIKGIAALSLPLILMACASQSPAPQQDLANGRGQGGEQAKEQSVARQAGAQPGTGHVAGRSQEASRPAQPPQQPVPIRARESRRGALPGAAQSLLSSAASSFKAGDYSAAIASAERGLRIARTSPELLLILARSYERQGDFAQARVFAERGMRYLSVGERRGEFEDLLGRLSQ